MMTELGLYLHIPFCRQKCYYCDFVSYAASEALYDEYIAALCREVAAQSGNFSAMTVDTVFIGGGTPTLLPVHLLTKLLNTIQKYFCLSPTAEVSIEANPGTVDMEKLLTLWHLGVNRLSFGVQTFTESLLKAIGRIHTGADGSKAIQLARQAGFANISLDLMYGLPGQTLAEVQSSLLTALALPVNHISVYGLTVAENTLFGRQQSAGSLQLPTEESEEAMYDLTVSLLPDHGYKRYEISNYAQPGYSCSHNLKYWRYQPYLGLGAGAHSFLAGRRLANTEDVAVYISSINQKQAVTDFSECVSQADAQAEYIFLRLRTVSGLLFKDFNDFFAVDFCRLYQDTVDHFLAAGLLSGDRDGICLTDRGMKYGNVVFCGFLPAK